MSVSNCSIDENGKAYGGKMETTTAKSGVFALGIAIRGMLFYAIQMLKPHN